MDFTGRLAEQKIREALQEGAFDNLPGKGKPLRLEDDSGVPESLRMCYKVLKNADVLPPEMELKKSLITLEEMIGACHDKHQRDQLRRKLTTKRLQFDMMMERRNAALPQAYRSKVLDKLT